SEIAPDRLAAEVPPLMVACILVEADRLWHDWWLRVIRQNECDVARLGDHRVATVCRALAGVELMDMNISDDREAEAAALVPELTEARGVKDHDTRAVSAWVEFIVIDDVLDLPGAIAVMAEKKRARLVAASCPAM